MSVSVQVRRDRVRGCGWRKEGGIYLVAEGPGRACGALPVPLDRCPTCDHGIKPTRGFTWVVAESLLAANVAECKAADLVAIASGARDEFSRRRQGSDYCRACPIRNVTGRQGLLWIGEKFYPTPDAWLEESKLQGVSRRIAQVPRAFVVGTHWILVAHRKAVRQNDGTHTPGIFQIFKPSAIEYVVTGDETEEDLEALVARGLTPVRVERDDSPPLFPKESSE